MSLITIVIIVRREEEEGEEEGGTTTTVFGHVLEARPHRHLGCERGLGCEPLHWRSELALPPDSPERAGGPEHFRAQPF